MSFSPLRPPVLPREPLPSRLLDDIRLNDDELTELTLCRALGGVLAFSICSLANDDPSCASFNAMPCAHAGEGRGMYVVLPRHTTRLSRHHGDSSTRLVYVELRGAAVHTSRRVRSALTLTSSERIISNRYNNSSDHAIPLFSPLRVPGTPHMCGHPIARRPWPSPSHMSSR